MSKVRSQWVEQADTYVFTGDVEVPTPVNPPQAVNKAYADALVQSVSRFTSDDLPYTDTTNMVIQLSSLPNNFNQVSATAIGGTALDYGDEFTIRYFGTTAFICLDPASTCPFGSFNGGDTLNPTIGILNILSANDELNICYSSAGVGGAPPGFQGVPGPQGNAGGPQGNTGTAGPTGPQGPFALNPGITADLTGTTTDSYVNAYSFTSANGGIAAITAEVVNTDPTNALGFQTRGTFFDGTPFTSTPTVLNAGQLNNDGNSGFTNSPGSDGGGFASVQLDIKSNTPGQPATYALYVRGIEVNSAGPQGASGFQGPFGATGFTGATGNTGVQGYQGAIGATGLQGVPGMQGANGSTGSTGSTGATGSTGLQGSGGPQGVPGSTGPTGNSGVQGFSGPQGIIGTTGSAGSQGSVGPQGTPGATNIFTISYDSFNQQPGTSAQALGAPAQTSMLQHILGSTSVPANSLNAGDVFAFEFWGTTFSNSGGVSIPSLFLVLGNSPYPSNQQLAGGALNIPGAVNSLFGFVLRGQVLIGATGAVFSSEVDIGSELIAYPAGVPPAAPQFIQGGTSFTKHIDTTSSNQWDLIVSWGSGINNHIIIRNGYLRKLN